MKSMLGKEVKIVDLSKERDACITNGVVAQERINNDGFYHLYVVSDKKLTKCSREFCFDTDDDALAFYDRAKPLAQKMDICREQMERDVDNLWKEMGIVPAFPEVGALLQAREFAEAE